MSYRASPVQPLSLRVWCVPFTLLLTVSVALVGLEQPWVGFKGRGARRPGFLREAQLSHRRTVGGRICSKCRAVSGIGIEGQQLAGKEHHGPGSRCTPGDQVTRK